MNPTDDIDKKYKKLLEREDDTRAKLRKAEEQLKTAREVDVEALAQAALAGEAAPKRTEVALRHKVDDLSVLLDGIDTAVWHLQQEARAAEAKRHPLRVFIPEGTPATRAEVVAGMKANRTKDDGETEEEFEARLTAQISRGNRDAESILQEAARQREVSLDRRLPRLTDRPAVLSIWIKSAYEAEDRQAESNYEARAKKQRLHDATEAVGRAKAEHLRRGKEAGSFRMQDYPDIVLPEHLAEFGAPITRSPFEKAREGQLPSFEEAQNVPVAEPQPVVNEEAELRHRENLGLPPAAAPDVNARIAEQLAATAHLEVPPSQTPIVSEEAA